MNNPIIRPRRLRQTEAIRSIAQETTFSVDNLIYPLFVMEGSNTTSAIISMPGCERYSIDLLVKEATEAYNLGIKSIALFPLIPKELKSNEAHEAYNPEGLIPQAIQALKKNLPNLCVIADIALDPYTLHGHDGIIDEKGNILNDETVEVLVKMAVNCARAGADIVAPSDMMDGRISAIREGLDENNFQNTLILAYSAKYASAFYGPFREALQSNLAFGDKRTYQMDPANAKEAEKEILLDISEGADLVMVKPGLAYLDIVYRASQVSELPVVVYSVSGEYSMIKAASQNDWIDEKKVVLETMISFRRAGANAIITYHAKEIAQWLKD